MIGGWGVCGPPWISFQNQKLKHMANERLPFLPYRLWNDFPLPVKNSPTLDLFKLRLKTYLFDIPGIIYFSGFIYLLHFRMVMF